MIWVLYVCISYGAICNVFFEFQFETQEMCEENAQAIIEQNQQVTSVECVEIAPTVPQDFE